MSRENRKGYKKTKLGWIPEEWEVVKLRRLISKLDSGKSVNCIKNEFSEFDVAVLKTSAVTNGVFKPNEIKIPIDEEKDKLKISVKKSRLLICRKNTPDLVGCCVLTKKDYSNLYIPDLIWQSVPNNSIEHNIKFLYLMLNENIIKQKIGNLANGSSRSMVNISKNSFLNISIPLPPLPEQQKIATILSFWDKAIDLTQQLIAEKEEQKKGLMQRLLTGKVRVKKFQKIEGCSSTRIGLVPKDWQILKSSEIFKSISIKNNSGKILLAVTQENGVIPRDQLEGRVTMPSGSTSSYKLVVPGNFVISLRSFQGGLEYSECEGIVSPAYTVLTNKIPIDDTFFKFYFKSSEFISRLAVAVIGIRDGKQISFSDFSALTFRYPSIEEQEAIGKILNKADDEINILKKKLDELEEQKKGLMQRLLTGKIRVN